MTRKRTRRQREKGKETLGMTIASRRDKELDQLQKTNKKTDFVVEIHEIICRRSGYS